MKHYIVITKKNRRLIVSAMNEDGAKRQVELGRKDRCPWTGKSINPVSGEPVDRVEPVGTLI